MPRAPLYLLLVTSLLGCPAVRPVVQAAPCNGVASLEELDALTIPRLPAWVDKYADTAEEDQRFFNMSRVMDRFQLGRAQAVELQNHYRDLTHAIPGMNPLLAFNTALERVLHGQFQSHLDLERLRKASFIIVFDLDETLWDQYYPTTVGEHCHDLVISQPSSKRYVKLVPGWQQAFARIQELGGAVVLYSANLEDVTLENLAQWQMDGVPLTKSPAISGILSNGHLILQDKSEGPSPMPIREPSKDLRIFDSDPELSRVIIVDDNPTRLFQMRNARIIKKFDAEAYCTPDTEKGLHTAFDNSLAQVVREIEESVDYMNQNKVTFATAYLPYTSLGQVAVRFLTESGQFGTAQAIEHVRRHPDIVDKSY
jgi:hypothetical protein